MTDFTRGIIVDGITFNLPLVSIKRKFDFLYKDGAGRTEDGVFHGELIGVYCNFTITVGKSSAFDGTDYEEFVEKMSEPNEQHTFSIPVKGGYYTFTGYLGSVSDEYEKILSDDTIFKGFTCNMVADKPARRPGE